MDTVIIKIYGPRKFSFRNKHWFLPELTKREYRDLSQNEKESTRLYLRHFVFHPPYHDGYVPKVEVYETLNKKSEEVIYIFKATFSIPKLLYGNSLQEVSSSDFGRVVDALRKALSSMGIAVTSEVVKSARVCAIHFCKNIPLPSNIFMREILGDLERIDVSKVVDITKTEFKNGGRVLHVYSGTVERVFYDKISDSLRPKVKRKDKEQIDDERNIVEKYGLKNREVFRYEYRIKKTQTVMRDVNTVLGREPKTFVALDDLFTPGLCKTMVLNSWQELIQRPENQLALFDPVSNLSLLLHITSQAKKSKRDAHSMNKMLISYGLARVIRDLGVKEVRGIIFGAWNNDHPERLGKKIEVAASLISGLPYSDGVSFVDLALQRYEIINLVSLENGI